MILKESILEVITCKPKNKTFPACWLACLLFLSASLPVSLVHAAAGDVITNIATASFTIGGVPSVVESSPLGNSTPGIGNGQTTQFTVDNRINFSVTLEDTAEISVVPGQLDAVLTFRLSNNGNAVQDFVLTAFNTSANPFNPPTDSIDLTNFNIYVEDGTNAGYQVAEDTQTFVDGLPFDPGAGTDNEVTVYLVGEIPAAAANDVAAMAIVAQVATSPNTSDGVQGALIVADDRASPNDLNNIDIVFADPAGASIEDIDVTGTVQDAQYNGQASDAGAFIVSVPSVNISKAVAIVSSVDGTAHGPFLSAGVNQPGATLRYTITVDVTDTNPVSNLIITDPIPANTTYVAESMTLDSVVQTDADNTGIDFANFNITLANGIAVDLSQGASITPPDNFIITFDVTVN